MTRAVEEVASSWLERLEADSDPCILLSTDYRILAANPAYLDRYPRPLQLGQDRCYAVSHGYDSPCDRNGETCPMARSFQSLGTERVFHVHLCGEHREHVDITLEPILDEQGRIAAFVERIRPITVASAHAEGVFVGVSAAFTRMLELIQRAARSEVPILLLGESGTGKELAAEAIHRASHRAEGPFVPVECSGLSESLFESELFGHVRGAFTGASRRKMGLVEAAAGGTLFLDEVGDVPPALQVKLLRLLESGTYRVVGDIEARKADFRLICATHRDLASFVADGRFRNDLYYRINAFPIPMPPLRERKQDLPLLCEALLRASGKTISPEALARLQAHPFPGNVRELRNLLERAVLLADQDMVQVRHLNLDPAPPQALVVDGDSAVRVPVPGVPAEVMPLAEVEARYLEWAAAHHDGDRASLAKKLGLSERTLYRKLQAVRRGDPTDSPVRSDTSDSSR